VLQSFFDIWICCSWSAKHRSELFIYGAESNGVIWDIAINRTSNPYDSLYVVGTFDTETRASQIQLCSVSSYDGASFSKVGTSPHTMHPALTDQEADQRYWSI
jgi:hypothetical protein